MHKKTLVEITTISAIIITIFSVAYAVNGIYPFGTDTIARGDLVIQNAPAMYYIWDIFHGNASPFFTWISRLGLNITGAIALGSLLSPLNLFLLFIPRSSIMDFINILVALKALAMGLSMYAYIRKKNVPSVYLILTSVIYALGAATLVHFQIPLVMDAAFFLPLIMMGLDRIWNNKSNLLFILMLGWSLALNLYMGAITLLFVFVYCGCKLIFDTSVKNNRPLYTFKLGTGVVGAFVISVFYSIPTLMCMGNTPRTSFGMRDTIEMILYHKWEFIEFEYVLRMLGGMALPIAFILTAVFVYKKQLKNHLWRYILICILVASALIPATEYMWHGGSRASWPVRFVFVITFSMLELMLSLIEEGKLNFHKKSIKIIPSVVILLCVIIGTALLTKPLYSVYCNLYADTLKDGVLILLLSIVWVIACVIILKCKKHSNVLFYISIAEIILVSTIAFTPNKDNIKQSNPEIIYSASRLEKTFEDLDLNTTEFERIKNSDYSVGGLEFGIITNHEAVSNAWHVIDARNLYDMARLGYRVNWTQEWDAGGTLVSDAMLHYSYLLSTSNMGNDLYTLMGNQDNTGIYRSNYTFPIVMPLNDVSISNGCLDRYSYTNAIWNSITSDDDIIIDVSNRLVDNTAEFHVDGTKVLYLYKATNYGSATNILVNNTRVINANITGDLSYYYPSPLVIIRGFYDDPRVTDIGCVGIVCLGEFTDEDVSIVINDSRDNTVFLLGELDADRFMSTVDSVNKTAPKIVSMDRSSQALDITIRDVTTPYILLPIGCEEGWSATINGQAVEIVDYSGLIALPIQEVNSVDGEYNINLRFFSPGMSTGIKISSIGALIIVAALIMGNVLKKNRVYQQIIRVIGTAAFYVYLVIFIFMMMVFFVVPLCMPLIG